MSKGIVRIKPSVTSRPHMGQVILTEADENQWKLVPGSPMSFDDNPPLTVNVGDIVECNFKSGVECEVTKIVGTATMAQGTLTLAQIKITAEMDPNPCNVGVGSKLDYNLAPGLEDIKDGDTVECLPFSTTKCDVTGVLVRA